MCIRVLFLLLGGDYESVFHKSGINTMEHVRCSDHWFFFAFYFILDHFETANILPSTLSVTTSFIAVYLTFRRNPYFALAYAANDIVLIFLWCLAAIHDIGYLSVVICFLIFLVNDIYGFVSWRKMELRQFSRDNNI